MELEIQQPENLAPQFTLNEDYDEEVFEKALATYTQPFLNLVQQANAVHKNHWPENDIQCSALLSVKTGNCPEDCSYCPQSARYVTDIQKHALLSEEEMVAQAQKAQENGATRFCMGASWRTPPRGEQFDRVLGAVTRIKDMGMETCVTLGLLSEEQSQKLKSAGLDYYNHNVDTSKQFYSKIITTRKFSDRVKTLQNLRKNGIHVCCGGILGMGESPRDRVEFLAFLASMDPQPESVPINFLVKFDGTPLEGEQDLDILEVVRTIATARILMPKTRIRISAGRMSMSRESQILTFVAGANSLFSGEVLLTSPLPGYSFDKKLLDDMLRPLEI